MAEIREPRMLYHRLIIRIRSQTPVLHSVCKLSHNSSFLFMFSVVQFHFSLESPVYLVSVIYIL